MNTSRLVCGKCGADLWIERCEDFTTGGHGEITAVECRFGCGDRRDLPCPRCAAEHAHPPNRSTTP